MLRRSGIVVGLAVMACVILAGTWALAEDNEEKIPVKDLPKKIVAVVKVVCPGGKILLAEREVEKKRGKVVVEYEMRVKLQDGNVVEVEVELDAKGNIRKVQVGEDDDHDDDDDDND